MTDPLTVEMEAVEAEEEADSAVEVGAVMAEVEILWATLATSFAISSGIFLLYLCSKRTSTSSTPRLQREMIKVPNSGEKTKASLSLVVVSPRYA